MGEIEALRTPLEEVQADLQKLKDIRYWVRKATPGTEESKEAPKKESLVDRLHHNTAEAKAQDKPEQKQQRKQNMEI